MESGIVLASTSEIRAALLRQVGVEFSVLPARVDEETARAGMIGEGLSHRDIADALAEMKARKVAEKNPSAFVIGCDQVLSFGDRLMAKPGSPEDAIDQILALSGETHSLLTAAVVYEGARPVWRHVAEVRLRMRRLTPGYVSDYVARNWDSIRFSVGGYKIEEEGARLFERVDGSHYAVLGLPLFELVSYLSVRGLIET